MSKKVLNNAKKFAQQQNIMLIETNLDFVEEPELVVEICLDAKSPQDNCDIKTYMGIFKLGNAFYTYETYYDDEKSWWKDPYWITNGCWTGHCSFSEAKKELDRRVKEHFMDKIGTVYHFYDTIERYVTEYRNIK